MNMGPQGPGPYNPPKANTTAIVVLVLVVAGLILVAVMAVMAAVLFPVFARARESARATSCMSNVQHLSTAMQAYQSEWDGIFPLADNWNASIEPFVKNTSAWHCPADKSGKPSYAMNRKLSGLPQTVVPATPGLIMFFDSKPGKNQAGGPELFPSEPRHMHQHVFAFADGHAAKVEQSAIGNLTWDPKKPVPGAP